MENYDEMRSKSEPTFAETVGPVIRVIAGILGLFIIVIGLLYAINLFSSIHEAIKTPEVYAKSLDQWENMLGKDEMTIRLGGNEFPLARIVAVMTSVAGAFILCWLAIGIMMAGARIISWSSGDREAVRKIIKEAMGLASKAR